MSFKQLKEKKQKLVDKIKNTIKRVWDSIVAKFL